MLGLVWRLLLRVTLGVVRSRSPRVGVILGITVKYDHQAYDLTPAIRQHPAFLAVSLTVFLQRSPVMFLAIIPIPLAKS
ncbi:hypothetical protein GW17_00047089 [Ensete ventricosum]|nr:hypothetical protein GW17_00047089 [Ensete ventricosum]